MILIRADSCWSLYSPGYDGSYSRGVEALKIGVLGLILALNAITFTAQPAFAKESFNIKGIKLGDTIEAVKGVFPDIEVEALENKAHCKAGDNVIENGTSFNAVKNKDFEKYIFRMIFVDGVQTVVKLEYSYKATSVNRELFIGKIIDKYDIDVIKEDNILDVKNSMSDYKGITRFVVPDGHFFEIEDKDILRLKYTSKITDPLVPGELTHTIEIESKNYNSLYESQENSGKVEKKIREEECGKQELEELGL
ncbi:MAG: hypothetical protein ISR45_00860 [Rhodospirillales bacterium]|nr:hypothetical protein [Rhodospirillales bacterium]